MKKNIALFTALIMLLSTLCIFASCGDTHLAEGQLMVCGDYVIDEGMYKYLCATRKAAFLSKYNSGFDKEEFFDTEAEINGKTVTYYDYIEDYIINDTARILISQKLFDEAGLELSDSAVKRIDDEINELLEVESEEEINTALSVYGIDLARLKEIKQAEAKSSAFYEYLYEDGEKAPTEDELNEFIKQSYAAVKIITIYTDAAPKRDDKGEYIFDNNGEVVMQTLDEEEKTRRAAKADDIIAALENGDDFNKYISDSDETYSGNKYGLLICNSDVTAYGREIVEQALSLKVGKCALVKTDGALHILYRIETPTAAQLADDYDTDAMLENCTWSRYLDDMDELTASSVKIDRSQIKKIDLKALRQNVFY